MSNAIGEEYLVVYADDDPDDLELVVDGFHNYTSNVRVLPFSDGVRAIAYLQNLSAGDTTPCLIILDINMPKMNGKECLKKIRRIPRLENVPIVLFTTSISERDKEFAKSFNVGFITKPLSAAQMERVTRELVGHCYNDVGKIISSGFK